jgi:hypothetical protein
METGAGVVTGKRRGYTDAEAVFLIRASRLSV